MRSHASPVLAVAHGPRPPGASALPVRRQSCWQSRRQWIAAIAFAGLVACNGGRQQPADSEGELVLEVGGEQSSLRQALLAAGAPLPAPRDETPAPSTPPPDAGRDGDVREQSEPATPPPPDPWTVVALAEGETIAHLARAHLGNGNRFHEILELNGWTEAASRRLRPGTAVKIPRPPSAAPVRR